MKAMRTPTVLAPVLLAGLLAGCGSLGAGVGLSVPVGPVSIGVGAGSGGLNVGVGTGVGPVGVGVGVNQRGQVYTGAGVGASVPIGDSPVRAGVGVGTGAVIYDPANRLDAPVIPGRPGTVAPNASQQVAP
ncbi:hypothetical protein ASG30_00515 [Ramlibacter sp. Leaf400]|nr:hypothetical protein ASG30_00515 [Ramlibacter sp. Leaf400]